MKKSSLVLVLATSFLTGNALAGSMGPVASEWTWVGAFSAGPVWGGGGKTQTFFLTPEIEKTYTGSNSTNAFFDGEVFFGVQKRVSQSLQGQLGLAVAATSDVTLSGFIWDDADIRFDNFTYNYKIQHTHIAAKGRLLMDVGYWMTSWVTPWLSASIGVAFNNAHSFENTPVIFEAVPNPNFSSHTDTAFTYTVGAGVQRALNAHWQVGVGYEFEDWGKSHLGRSLGQTLNSGLSLNHFYTNGLLFNLTYLA